MATTERKHRLSISDCILFTLSALDHPATGTPIFQANTPTLSLMWPYLTSILNNAVHHRQGNVLTIIPAIDVKHLDKVRTEISSCLDTFPDEKKDLYEPFNQKATGEKWDSSTHPEQNEKQKSAFSDYFQEQQSNIKALSKGFSKYPQIDKIQVNLMKKKMETTICLEEYSALFMEEVKKIDRNLFE